MKCEEFCHSTYDYIDGELSQGKSLAFRKHLEVCGECAEDFEDSEYIHNLFRILRSKPDLTHPKKASILSRIHDKLKSL